jgi:hypothetical protein
MVKRVEYITPAVVDSTITAVRVGVVARSTMPRLYTS